jgi:anthranilate/para-aminobenzoate synthase component II
VLASGADGSVQAIGHRALPQLGLQFHPESILTAERPILMRNLVRWLQSSILPA